VSEHDHEAEILRRIARETNALDHRLHLERAADIMQERGRRMREQFTSAKTYCFVLGLPDFPRVEITPVREGIEIALPEEIKEFSLSTAVLRSMLEIAERGR
jgi:hypothetical protein